MYSKIYLKWYNTKHTWQARVRMRSAWVIGSRIVRYFISIMMPLFARTVFHISCRTFDDASERGIDDSDGRSLPKVFKYFCINSESFTKIMQKKALQDEILKFTFVIHTVLKEFYSMNYCKVLYFQRHTSKRPASRTKLKVNKYILLIIMLC